MKVAFIGAGTICREHLKAFSYVPDVTAVGIFSITKSKAKNLATEFSIPHIADSIDDLFYKTQADAVIIAVSEIAVEDVFLRASKYSWFILVEKPLGLNIQQTKKICELSGNKKSECFVALNRRQYSSVIRAVQEIELEPDKRFVIINDQEDPCIALENGRKKEVCQQWHFANSIHLVDLFFNFCRGSVKSISCVSPWKGPFEKSVGHYVILFSSGDIGVFHTVWNMPGPWSVSIETHLKRVQLLPIEKLTIQKYGSRYPETVKLSDDDEIAKPGFIQQITELKHLFQNKNHNLASITQYLETANLVENIFSNNQWNINE